MRKNKLRRIVTYNVGSANKVEYIQELTTFSAPSRNEEPERRATLPTPLKLGYNATTFQRLVVVKN